MEANGAQETRDRAAPRVSCAAQCLLLTLTLTVNGGPGLSSFQRFRQNIKPPKASSMIAAVKPP